MSTHPLPSSNPRRQTPQPFGKEGPIRWGKFMGAGCWLKSCLTVAERGRLIARTMKGR